MFQVFRFGELTKDKPNEELGGNESHIGISITVKNLYNAKCSDRIGVSNMCFSLAKAKPSSFLWRATHRYCTAVRRD